MINFDPEILKHIICFMYTGCLNVPPTVSPDQILLAGIKLGLDAHLRNILFNSFNIRKYIKVHF